MRRLRIFSFICLALSASLLILSTVLHRVNEDTTIPELRCPEGPLVLSLLEDDVNLLQGVTARDEKDGDLTDRVLVQSVEKVSGGSAASVTYAVVDSDNHVATCTREVRYSDYTPPRFALSRPLRYSTGSYIRIMDRLTARDSLDGDLSSQIRVSIGNINSAVPGVYPASVEVTNSVGDTASLALDIEVKNPLPGEPDIRLTQYLVYRSEGDPFHAMSYVQSVTGGNAADITAQIAEGEFTRGVNKVLYSCPGANGAVGTAVLYVVTE